MILVLILLRNDFMNGPNMLCHHAASRSERTCSTLDWVMGRFGAAPQASPKGKRTSPTILRLPADKIIPRG